jgi:hypothetical protein
MLKTFLTLCVFSTAALAQFGIGLKLGVPASDAFRALQAQTVATADQYVLGPYVDLGLPGGNSIEIDALRRRYNIAAPADAQTWEFPVVFKHRLTSGVARPYIEGGAAFSRISDIRISTLKNRQNYGLVVGGGVELRLLFFRVSPEIRYTSWALRNFEGTVQSNRNQLAVLVGVGF